MKVLVVFGTRPEAIKMCPVIIELRKRKGIVCKIVLIGQHREMLDQVMEIFRLSADYDLDIMSSQQSLENITCLVIRGLSEVIKEEHPDMILVHGDTTTSYAAAVTAFYNDISVGHVEAGLRTGNLREPFPEEFNRQSVDMISEYMFAPTETARKNLISEGKDKTKIYVTGNTVIDALKITVKETFSDENIQWVSGKKFVLLTVHRRENWGKPLQKIFEAVKLLAETREDVRIIYPVHKNPKVRECANEMLGHHANIRLIEPLDVFKFHNYMSQCYFVMTDSGGIQEEAPSLGKPVLVLRNVTERPEGIEAGTLRLVGCDTESIYKACNELLDSQELYDAMSTASNPYGDGTASERICNVICQL